MGRGKVEWIVQTVATHRGEVPGQLEAEGAGSPCALDLFCSGEVRAVAVKLDLWQHHLEEVKTQIQYVWGRT